MTISSSIWWGVKWGWTSLAAPYNDSSDCESHSLVGTRSVPAIDGREQPFIPVNGREQYFNRHESNIEVFIHFISQKHLFQNSQTVIWAFRNNRCEIQKQPFGKPTWLFQDPKQAHLGRPRVKSFEMLIATIGP